MDRAKQLEYGTVLVEEYGDRVAPEVLKALAQNPDWEAGALLLCTSLKAAGNCLQRTPGFELLLRLIGMEESDVLAALTMYLLFSIRDALEESVPATASEATMLALLDAGSW